jgi:hypothetical protein
MLTKTTPKDTSWAMAVTLAGGLALLVAHRVHWHPQDMSPGVEGCLTATVLAFVLALLHPLSYGRALVLSVPLVAGEYLACAYAEGAPMGLAVVGMHLVVMGFAGLALARRDPQPATQARRATRAVGSRPLNAHS